MAISHFERDGKNTIEVTEKEFPLWIKYKDKYIKIELDNFDGNVITLKEEK